MEWRDWSDEQREKDNHGRPKFSSPVTPNSLPASNLGAISERLADLIGNDIGAATANEIERRTDFVDQCFEKIDERPSCVVDRRRPT